MSSLLQARAEREEAKIDASIDVYLDEKLKGATVSRGARAKLRDLIKKAAANPTPFRTAVKDNLPILGPGRAEAVAAALSNEIKSHKNWYSKSKTYAKASLAVDGDVLIALSAVSEIDVGSVFLEARALDEGKTVEAVALLGVTVEGELRSWGDGLALAEKS